MSSIVIWILCGLAVGLSVVEASSISKHVASACQTPTNEPGQCIALRKCPPLYAIILNQTTTAPAAVHFLRQSECGFVGRFRIYCCANSYDTATPWVKSRDSGASEPKVAGGKQEVMESVHELKAVGHKDDQKALTLSTHENKHLLPTESCGRQEVFDPSSLPRIGEHPWTVLLQYENDAGDSSFSCGGVVISKLYVLTAARCTSAGNTQGKKLVSVRVSEHKLATSPDCEEFADGEEFCGEPFMDVEVELEIPHPGYVRGSKNPRHDIALLRLERDVLTNIEGVIPICLPISDDILSLHANDVEKGLLVAGWGITNNGPSSSMKLSSEVKVMNRTFCIPRDVMKKTQMCAMAESCAGDNGGAVVNRANDGRYYVVGVASTDATACGAKQKPVVFTRVSEYSGWILDQLSF